MDIESEIERFREDWEIDFPSKRIWRKAQPWHQWLLELFYKPKYPVIALYRFTNFHLDSPEGSPYENIMDRSVGTKVADIPTWYQISEEWVIDRKNLAYLYLGPLIQGQKELVPAIPKNGFFMTVWQLVGVISTVGGAITFVAWLLGVR